MKNYLNYSLKLALKNESGIGLFVWSKLTESWTLYHYVNYKNKEFQFSREEFENVRRKKLSK